MLESPRNRSGLGRVTRTIGPVIGLLTICMTLGNNGVTLPAGEAPRPVFDNMQAGPVEDMEKYLDCLLRKLMGLSCEDDGEGDPSEPPSPTDPVGSGHLI